jgi:uncharacterized membrane protein YidH (DUF202 family)
MTSQCLNGTTVILCMVSVALLIASSVNYSNDRGLMETTSWIMSNDEPVDLYFCLRGILGVVDSSGADVKFLYRDHVCQVNYCEVCQRFGETAFALNIIAAGLSMVVLVLSAANIADYSRLRQFVGVFLSCAAAVVSVVSIAVFMGNCWTAIVRENSQLQITWGLGAILTTIGMIVMWVVLLFQMAAAITGGPSHSVVAVADPVPSSPSLGKYAKF